MSKLDETKLNLFVDTVKKKGADTIICIAAKGNDQNVLYFQGREINLLAAATAITCQLAKESGAGVAPVIETLLKLSEDTPMKK